MAIALQLLKPPDAPRGARGALVLDERLPLRAGLGAAFAGVVGYAQAMADATRTDPLRGVGEYRQAVRRARAMVRLARPLLSRFAARAMGRILRKALEASAPLREAQLLERALADLPGRAEDPGRRAALAALAALREEPRAQEGDDGAEALRRSAWALRGLPERFFEALPREVRWADLEAGLRRSYRRARRASARPQRGPEDLRRLRQRVQELRYQLELLEAAGELAPLQDSQALARLAQRLGAAGDLLALRRALAPRAELESAAGRRLLRAIDARAARLLRGAHARSRALFERRPRRFASRVMGRLRAA